MLKLALIVLLWLLRWWALGQQWIDPREEHSHYEVLEDAPDGQTVQWRSELYLTTGEHLAEDLALLLARRADLADCPRVEDAGRFPPREVAAGALAHLRAHLAWLELQRAYSPTLAGAAAEDAEAEAKRLALVCDAAHDAAWDDLHVPCRRHALARLRDLLGEDAYQRGAMPPVVPLD